MILASENVPDQLLEAIEGLDGATADHAIAWTRAWWEREDLRTLQEALEEVWAASRPGTKPGWRLIARRDVFGLADPDRPLPMFLGAMAWGFGNRGYGPARVAKMIASQADIAEFTSKLRGQMLAAVDGPHQAWNAFRSNHRIKGLGPAFATKVAYFSAFANPQAGPSRPLIADLNTAWGIWTVARQEGSHHSRAGYITYVELAHNWAAALGRCADDVERALFELGKDARS